MMDININIKISKIFASLLTGLFILALITVIPGVNKAYAQCGCCNCAQPVTDCSLATCACTSTSETGTQEDPDTTIFHVFDQFIQHETWLVETVFQDHLLPSMMLMANQISTIALQQMQVIGSFFDAKHQMESQRLLQQLQAQAHKDYQPSTGMCQFGTNMRSLAASDANVNFNHIAIASRNTQRTLMTSGAIGTGSTRDDGRSRLQQFRNTYCNRADFGNALHLLCHGGGLSRRNRDINYTATLQDQETLNINFVDTAATSDEQDVLALSANLYGNRLFPYIPEVHMADTSGNIIDKGAFNYMATRALTAKRSVAFNSYAAQAAQRSEGGEAALPYLRQILLEMGMPAGAITQMLKEKPSYHAQMEVLTKKLFQTPQFYSNLYDKPVNVDRKDTAIQAIGSIQKRDIYRSQLRAEANLAVFLETLVDDMQEYNTNEVAPIAEDKNKILFDLGL